MMRTLRTPDGPAGLLCWPPLSEWAEHVQANREKAAGWTFDIEGVPAQRLRARARRALLAFAQNVTGERADWDRPLLVTGHQPEFYHPGIWIKAFAVTKAAKDMGGFGLNLAVDHDAGELSAHVPWRDADGLRVAKHYLVRPKAGRPLETMPAPTEERVERFIAEIEERLATLGEDEVPRHLWRAFADGLRTVVAEKGAAAPRTAAEVGLRSRAVYEGALGQCLVSDVPVSWVSATGEFLLFFVHWAVNARPLLEAYNDALAEFRTRHRVRSLGNPFPDLLIRPDGAVELPFWGLTTDGIRRKLYARRAGDDIVLENLEGVFARLPASGGDKAVSALIGAGVQIRPRAVPLTVFHRLFVADLFIHGTGGARYDEVTDGLIRRYFGIEPPSLAVVSATFHLPLRAAPVQFSAVQKLRHKLRDLRWNPQRYAWEASGVDEETDERLAELVKEKERLIDEMVKLSTSAQACTSSGKGSRVTGGPSPKRIMTRAIETTNARLYELLTPVVRRTEAELQQLLGKARSAEAATRRTYPFFFYDAEAMRALLRTKTTESIVGARDGAQVACCGVDC